MLAVTGGAKIPLFAYAQNLALSPDASALYMTVGGVCVMRLTGNGLRQELVAGQCPGQQLQPGLQQRDGPGKQARFVGIGALRVTNTVVMAIDSGAPRFILINSQAAVFTPPDLPRSSGDAYALADVVSVGGCALAVAGGNTTLYLIGPTGGVSSSASVVGYDATAVELFDYSSRSELWVFLLSSAGALMRVGVRYDSTRGQLLQTRDSAVVFKWNSNGFLFPAVDGLRMVQPSASNQMVVVDTASELHSVVALQPCKCHSGLSFQSAFPLGDFNTGVCVQPPAGTYVDGVGGLSICASCLDKLAALCPRGTVLRGVVCAWSPLLSGSSSSSVAPAIAVEILSAVPAVAASGQLDVVAPFSDMGLNDAVSSGGDFDVHFEVRLASDATTIAYAQVMLEAELLWQLTLSPPATRNQPPAFDYIQEHSPWTSTSAARGVLGRNEGSLGQLWKRSPSLTGPPNALTPRLPGIWTACSAAVGHDQPCTCVIQPRATLPAPWEAARNRIWPRVSPDAFYVTRTDSLANPIFVSSALRETIVEVASPQYAIGTFADLFQPAVCVFGWPATYSCPERMEWASPTEDWPAGRCVPSGIGFLAASDAVGLYCVDAVPFKDSVSSQPYCIPCPPGLIAVSAVCVECPPGTFESTPGSCTRKNVLTCPSPFYTLVGMGPAAEDECVPFPLETCSGHVFMGSEGPLCTRLDPLPGLQIYDTAALGELASLVNDMWYSSCGVPPPFSQWVVGPTSTRCYYACLYADSGNGNIHVYESGRNGSTCLQCRTDSCASGTGRPLSRLYPGCGPAVLLDQRGLSDQADGCIAQCALPPLNARLINSQCSWACNPNYALRGGRCIACSSALCAAGEYYYAAMCPHGVYCVPCQAMGEGVVVDMALSLHGACAFKCTDGWVQTQQLSDGGLVCSPCAQSQALVCPASQRKVCAPTRACEACPSASSTMIALPSSDSTCWMTCRPGYSAAALKTLALVSVSAAGYDMSTTTCVQTSGGFTAKCSDGYYLPSTGSTCVPCLTATPCTAGFFRSGCQFGLTPPQCVQCSPSLLLEPLNAIATGSRMWITSSQVLQVAPFARPVGSPGCVVVCSNNYAFDGKACRPCSELFSTQIDIKYFAMWNATSASRWWGEDMDALLGMPARRASTTVEQRGGVCWPCPRYTTSVYDLCDTPTTYTTILPISHSDVNVFVYANERVLPLVPLVIININNNTNSRRLLTTSAYSNHGPCPLHQQCMSGDKTGCQCACVAGRQAVRGLACELCARGFYKNHVGFSKCSSCPAGMNTTTVGSTSKRYCIKK